MEYPLNQSLWQNVFCVPAAAVDRCLASASGDEVKVLLAVLRCREESVSSRQIAKISGVREDAVDAAVAYWVEQKILPAQLIGAVPPAAIKQEHEKNRSVPPRSSPLRRSARWSNRTQKSPFCFKARKRCTAGR